MADDLDSLRQRIMYAHDLLNAGKSVEAEQALAGSADFALSIAPHPLSMLVFRLLGQCARLAGRYADARQCYTTAYTMATELQDPDMASAAAMGLATVEVADGHLAKANDLYDSAVQFARLAGPGPGLASVLQGHAEVLYLLGDDKSADLFGEALTQPDLSDVQRAILMENLGLELYRQGRTEEALEQIKAAAGMLHQAGAGYDLFKTLLSLARISRGADDTLAGKTFVQAHDLIHRLHGDVDVAHYQGYPARAEQIEAETVRLAMAGGLPAVVLDDAEIAPPRQEDVNLEIGVRAAAAQQAMQRGEELTMHRRYAEAKLSLREAGAYWESLGAHHQLPRIWCSLGLLYLGIGDYGQARSLLDQARWQARELGIAPTEFVALVNLCVLASGQPDAEIHVLELLAQARAVGSLLATPDFGTLDSVAADVCERNGATELAANYLMRSVGATTQLPPNDVVGLNRLAQRLTRLAHLTKDYGQARARLAQIPVHDPLVRYPVTAGLGRLALAAGEQTQTTLTLLRDACAAYEEVRARGGDLTGSRTQVTEPPYIEAAELALRLGAPVEAFNLLERWKSRSLLEELRDYPPQADDPVLAEEAQLWAKLRALRTPDGAMAPAHLLELLRTAKRDADGTRDRLEEIWRTLPVDFRTRRLAEPITAAELPPLLQGASLVEFFVAGGGVYAFTISANGLTATQVIDGEDPALPDFLWLLNDESPATIGRLLDHPLYGKITAVVEAARNPVYVVPHNDLHRAPFPARLLPSASVLRGSVALADGPVLIAGDPLGDLPFARAECAHAAERFGVEAKYGEEVTAEWLAASLGSSQLVHLACHAEFDKGHPERSGLVFAGSTLLTLSYLGSLDWSGSIVVLSACHSGRHQVGPGDELAGLGRTLLAAGATALVASVRPVPDLATALLMTWFYDRIDPYLPATVEHVSTALVSAQSQMRDITARDLIAWAQQHAGNGGDRAVLAEALTEAAREAAGRPDDLEDPAYLVKPFADPMHWAAFAVYGAG
ncbi:MAG: CHAT domain-containing protein [Kibdelosporangium sp.]